MKWYMILKNLLDRLPYWYSGLDDNQRLSINAMSFVIGISLAFGLFMPSWASASDCSVQEFSDFTPDQIITVNTCVDLAFKDSAELYASDGPLVAHMFITYRAGWCIYHEYYPGDSLDDYHEWLLCRNSSESTDYFF